MCVWKYTNLHKYKHVCVPKLAQYEDISSDSFSHQLILISLYKSVYLFLLLLSRRFPIHRPLCRQIAMPLSRRSAKWFNSAAQIQLRFRRLSERPVSARFCAIQREWSARASKMSTGWKLVRSGT